MLIQLRFKFIIAAHVNAVHSRNYIPALQSLLLNGRVLGYAGYNGRGKLLAHHAYYYKAGKQSKDNIKARSRKEHQQPFIPRHIIHGPRIIRSVLIFARKGNKSA